MLKFSESEINLRIHAARAIAKNRKLLDMLESGETNVTAIGRLAPHLEGDKAETLIEEVRGKSRREVEWIVAKEQVAAKAVSSPAVVQAPEPQVGLFEERLPKVDREKAAIREELRDRRDRVVPLSGDEAELRFLASKALLEKLERAQVLLARRYPRAAFSDVLGEVLEFFLERRDPARRDARRAAKGSAAANAASTRRVPRPLRDKVFARDSHRCVAVEPDGRRCGERRWLEADHVVPAALGGATTLDNLRTFCRRHNQAAAVAAFGAEHVAAAIANRRNH